MRRKSDQAAVARRGHGRGSERCRPRQGLRWLAREALKVSRQVLGDHHPDTLISINSLSMVLINQGKFNAARPLLCEALEARRQKLGGHHPETLKSIGNLADLLREQGRLDEASAVMGNAPIVAAEVLGDLHRSTLILKAKAARLMHGLGGGTEALQAVVASMEAVVGVVHPQTVKYTSILQAAVSKAQRTRRGGAASQGTGKRTKW